MTEPVPEIVWAAECLLHLDLLVEHQPDQERQGITLEELVCRGVVGPLDRHRVCAL
jgi:hypothetical protein